jgi:hypothetical protein
MRAGALGGHGWWDAIRIGSAVETLRALEPSNHLSP